MKSLRTCLKLGGPVTRDWSNLDVHRIRGTMVRAETGRGIITRRDVQLENVIVRRVSDFELPRAQREGSTLGLEGLSGAIRKHQLDLHHDAAFRLCS